MHTQLSPLRRWLQHIDAQARAYDQRLLAEQLKRWPMAAVEQQRYRDFVQRWGGLRGWLLLFGALALLAGAGGALSLLAGLPWPLALLLCVSVSWLVLAAGVGWLLPSAWLRPPRQQGRRFAALVLLALLGALAGWTVGRLALMHPRGGSLIEGVDLGNFLAWMAAGALGAALLVQLLVQTPARLRARLDRAETERLRQENEVQRQQLELARVRQREQQLEIALAQSTLQVLRAQVEPHFIFNTLGAAQQLAEQRSAEAAPLIARLIGFLRAAMPQLRRSDSTLGEERTLVEAYLGIMQTRIGARLSWRFVADADIAGCRVPPGLLLTLAENAIKHGVEPSCEPVDITITLRRAAPGLQLQVADSGVGLGATGVGSPGVGLANLRAQLATLHGDAATLDLAENEPRGFVATVRMPCDRAVPEPSLEPAAPAAPANRATQPGARTP